MPAHAEGGSPRSTHRKRQPLAQLPLGNDLLAESEEEGGGGEGETKGKVSRSRSGGQVLNISRTLGRQDLKNTYPRPRSRPVCMRDWHPTPRRMSSLLEAVVAWCQPSLYTRIGQHLSRSPHTSAGRIRPEPATRNLKAQHNITLSFDSGTTRKPRSVYTFHAITSDRRVFLVRGDEASGFSQTSEHFSNVGCDVSRPFSYCIRDSTDLMTYRSSKKLAHTRLSATVLRQGQQDYHRLQVHPYP